MSRRKITCPESAHIEEIETVEDAATGDIIEVKSCTAFHPPGVVECGALCAERLNRKLRRASDGEVATVSDDSGNADNRE